MKKIILLAIISFATISMTTDKTKVSDHELKYVTDFYGESIKILENTLTDLNESQLNFRPADGGWTIKECLEHIILGEEAIMKKMKETIQENKVDRSKDLSKNDAIILTRLTNRGDKKKTFKPFEPTGRWKTKDEMYNVIKANRYKVLKIINTTDADIRHLFTNSPVGEVDIYQFYIVYAGHTLRHTLQIQEILEEYKAKTSN